MKNEYLLKNIMKVTGFLMVLLLTSHMSFGQRLIINEVLADPASDISGDANGDGTRSASGDEFIEFVNVGSSALDISGWQVLDTNSVLTVRHVFPANTVIPARGALVLFGGGTPTGDFGGSVVQVASTGGLAITNTNEMLLVVNAAEDTVIRMGFPDFNNDMSWTRAPEMTGDFVMHTEADVLGGSLFSPGTKADGAPFIFDLLAINEVLADPASDISGDANGDGTRSASEDEFIEFLNLGSSSLDISGWQVLDTNSALLVRHVFPANSIIPPNGALVLFGGGTPTGNFGGSVVQVASTGGLAITNTKEMLLVVNAAQDTVIRFGFPDFNNDMAWTRDPEGMGDFVMHTSALGADGKLFSPGTKADGSSFLFDLLVINEVLADPASGDPGDANGDGTRSASDDEFIEFVNKGFMPLDISGWQVLDTNSTLLVRHIFPENTVIQPGKGLVVFGGGNPTGDFGGSIVQVASTGSLGITNTNEMFRIVNDAKDTLISFGFLDFNNDMSWTRDPDVMGDFVAHNTAVGAGAALFSPGTKTDGSPFGSSPANNLIINELLADPASDITGDANGDGTRSASEDEFIEFVNIGSFDLDISGWQVLDTNTALLVRHIFPDNTIVPAGGALVLFGGGTPTGTFGNSIVQTASTGSLGITNANEQLLVVDAKQDTVIRMGFGDLNNDKAWTRDPDIIGETFVAHDTASSSAGKLFSPGTRIDGSFFIVPESTIVQFSAITATAKEGDGSLSIELSIAVPSSSVATTVDVELVKGTASDINNYTTQTVTFPAGSGDPQTITITITDDTDIEPSDTLHFDLKNLAGGNTAVLGANNRFELILVDNDFATSTLIINEFMAWPAGQDTQAGDSPTVDSNGDGGIDIYEDEFIEFVNAGTVDLDISGWKIYDEVTSSDPLRHVFSPGTVINPGGALLVFGGGNPTGTFGGTPWQLASMASLGLGMTNSGDVIIIKNASDETVLELAFGQQTRSTSTTLNPDITGAIGPHPVLGTLNISPGTKVDGTSFAIATSTEVKFAKAAGGVSENATGAFSIELAIVRPDATAATTAEVIITSTGYEADLTYTTQTVTFPAGSSANQSITVTAINDTEVEGDELYLFSISTVSGGTSAKKGTPSTFELVVIDDDVPLIFNEVHADPASGASGDANADGISDPAGDEFIEVINNSLVSVDMSGWEFHDGTQVRHIFEQGTTLLPGKAIVVFGGGIPVGTFGGSKIQISSEGGLDLDDTGDVLTIFNGTGGIAAKTIYGALASDNQSITRDPDYTGGFAKHSSVENASGALFSPGTKTNGSAFTSSVLAVSPSTFIHVYPNPAVDQLTISATRFSSEIEFRVYNLSGSEISRLKVEAGAEHYLDITSFKKGLYIYEIRNATSGLMLEKGKIIFGK